MTVVVRRASRRLWNALGWLAAMIETGVCSLVTSWLEGVVAYGVALHGTGLESNSCSDRPAADDDREPVQASVKTRDVSRA